MKRRSMKRTRASNSPYHKHGKAPCVYSPQFQLWFRRMVLGRG